MRTVIVAHRQADCPLDIPGIEVVPARDYLTDPRWPGERGLRVINLCRSYGYQSEGYYVSLLAAARRHRPFPGLMTVLDMKSRYLVRAVDGDLEDLMQASLADIRSPRFELSIYFGRNLAARHGRLARRLFEKFPAPLLRASFQRGKVWRMVSMAPIALRDVPASHWSFLHETAAQYLARRRQSARASRVPRYDVAILHDPDEALAPSDPRALARFRNAAQKEGLGVEMIRREDYGRLAEFDGLFLRETTWVNHHTFRFAQRAEAEGLVVIDDPTSILRCTNKVFQAEALALRGIPMPRTSIMERADAGEIERTIGLPCVLKYPDSSFSRGVIKCSTREEAEQEAQRILEDSDLLLAQEYVPTECDWRIGVFAGEPLFVCRYHMARGHWQVVKRTGSGKFRYGRVEPVALDAAPARVVRMAVRAAGVVGDGLYGVDIKEVGDRMLVTEINDNPNIDAGCEDAILKDELYRRIMRGFLSRIEAGKRRNAS